MKIIWIIFVVVILEGTHKHLILLFFYENLCGTGNRRNVNSAQPQPLASTAAILAPSEGN